MDVQTLFRYIRENNEKKVKKALKDGFDVNTQNENGVTAIIVAANDGTTYRSNDMVKLIMSYNPDLSLKNIMKMDVFDLCSDKSILNLLKHPGLKKLGKYADLLGDY